MKTNTKLIKKMNEICSCSADKYCLLKEIIACSHNSPRFLIQLKCVEMFKWDLSKKANQDVGWDVAHMEWVSRGYAKKFSELYESCDSEENIRSEDLYKKVIKN